MGESGPGVCGSEGCAPGIEVLGGCGRCDGAGQPLSSTAAASAAGSVLSERTLSERCA
jgi:hypothetical protein